MKTLNNIIEHKKEEINKKKLNLSDSEIKEQIISNKKSREFYKALRNNNKPIGVIAEIKKASPSKGIIRKNFDLNKIAQNYERSGANCLSVLTDKLFFHGDDDYIKMVKKVVKIPVLRKDFIIDSWQIKESKLLNADCILLILSCLSFNQAKEYEHEAFELGMDVLIETHSHKEIEMANQLKSKIIGVNNRNLKTMEVNIQNSIDLFKYIEKSKLPISESGISDRKDILKLNKKGYKNFLIGEAFMKQKNIDNFYKKIISN